MGHNGLKGWVTTQVTLELACVLQPPSEKRLLYHHWDALEMSPEPSVWATLAQSRAEQGWWTLAAWGLGPPVRLDDLVTSFPHAPANASKLAWF